MGEFRGDKYAAATLFFMDENKTYDVDSRDHARGLAEEKGVLFFDYKPIGFFADTRYYLRPDMLSDWRLVPFPEFLAALKRHRDSA